MVSACEATDQDILAPACFPIYPDFLDKVLLLPAAFIMMEACMLLAGSRIHKNW